MGRFGKPVLGVLREKGERERDNQTLRDMTQPGEKDKGKGGRVSHLSTLERERKALFFSLLVTRDIYENIILYI